MKQSLENCLGLAAVLSLGAASCSLLFSDSSDNSDDNAGSDASVLDGGESPDGSAIDSGPTECLGILPLVDSFEMIDAMKWKLIEPGVAPAIVGGQLEVQLDSFAPNQGGLQTLDDARRDLTDQRVFVNVVETTPGVSTNLLVSDGGPGSEVFRMRIQDDTVFFEYEIEGEAPPRTIIGSMPVGPLPTYIQLRHTGTQLVGEFGPDLGRLIELASHELSGVQLEALKQVFVQLKVETPLPLSGPGPVRLDNFNVCE